MSIKKPSELTVKLQERIESRLRVGEIDALISGRVEIAIHEELEGARRQFVHELVELFVNDDALKESVQDEAKEHIKIKLKQRVAEMSSWTIDKVLQKELDNIAPDIVLDKVLQKELDNIAPDIVPAALKELDIKALLLDVITSRVHIYLDKNVSDLIRAELGVIAQELGRLNTMNQSLSALQRRVMSLESQVNTRR